MQTILPNKICSKICAKNSPKRNLYQQNFWRENSIKKYLKENSYQTKRKKYLPKSPWRNNSTSKSLKKNVDRKFRSLYHKKSLKRSLYNKNREISAKKIKKDLYPKKHFPQCRIAKTNLMNFFEMRWKHSFMKFRQILAGSNLGRNPSPKQEPQKILLKPSKRISTNAIYKQICTKKTNSKKSGSFLSNISPRDPYEQIPRKSSVPPE